MSPEPTTSPTGEQAAVQYINDSLQKARATLRKTTIIATVLVLIVASYLTFITYKLRTEFLNPKPAATMAASQLRSFVVQNGPEITKSLKEQIPPMIAKLPDLVLEQLPNIRLALEQRLEDHLREYLLQTSEELGSHLDGFLDEHKENVDAFVEAAQDPEGTKVLGEQLEEELNQYITAKGDDGRSIHEKMDEVLDALKKMESQLDRLAHAKDLTPQELKLRYAIAVIMQAGEREAEDINPPVQVQ